MSQIAFEMPRRPRSWTSAGAAQRADLRLGQAGPRRGGRAELGDRARVTQRERRLEFDEAGHGQQRRVDPLTGQHNSERRLGGENRVPGRGVVESREDRVRVLEHECGQGRVELAARAPPRELPGRRDAADAMRDLGVFRELRESGRPRDRLAREGARPAPPVPLLVGCPEGVEHLGGQLRARRPGRAPSRRGG